MRPRFVPSLAPAGAAALLVAAPLALASYPPPLRTHRYAVATDHTEASRAAAAVMHAGGNAADGAIAAALALGVVNPASSGIGGGGFATICSPRGECTFIDFREIAPAALTSEAITRAANPTRASQVGGLAVGVPGEPAGLLEISRRFGHTPFARVVAPAIALARNGYTASEYFAERAVHERAEIESDPNLGPLVFPHVTPIVAGARLRRPRLASALARYARERDRFVRGALATAIADAVRAHNGVMTARDVQDYRPVERTPLTRPFRGFTIVTAPPPSAGGIILLEALALVDAQPDASLHHGSSAYDHVLAEAFRGGFDDRARYVGDPGPQASSPVADALLDPARLARRNAAFDPAHTRPVVVIEPARDHGTSHICVIDANGMAVSLTTTVNLILGARFTVPSMDIVLNDEMDDFSFGTPGNNFGMAVSSANALRTGHRPVSSMSPTIILRDGRPVGCAGASGGPRIATATTQVVLNLTLHNMNASAAVSAPRIHHQGTPDQLMVDDEVPDDVRAALTARGHHVVPRVGGLAATTAIWVREQNGVRIIESASDPRKPASPAGE
jgi:gamma-glutamyltranspeptidase/glutathione hydrolase